MGFEQRNSFKESETDFKEQIRFGGLWQKYKLEGRTPRIESDKFSELKSCCEKFVDMAVSRKDRENIGDDPYLKMLHNQIALLVTKELWQKMNTQRLNEISDFAFDLTKTRQIKVFKSESPEEIENENKLKEQDRVNRLWNKYNLNGKAPKVGTPVFDRLKIACEKYINFVMNPSVNKMSGSDSQRRVLHNEIAVMVDGEIREHMEPARAEEIANFACMLVHNLTITAYDEIYMQSVGGE